MPELVDGLTPLAKQDWTLEAGESDFHAARGLYVPLTEAELVRIGLQT